MENKNGADMDPYQDRPLYRPIEIQGELIDPDWQQELDDYTKEYHPFQEIIPDTRVGFDSDGHFHAVEHFTADALNNIITPFRWADYLQDALLNYIGNFEYTVGRSERDDIVQDIIAERMESLDTMEERQQLEEAYYIWRNKYGRGYRLQP